MYYSCGLPGEFIMNILRKAEFAILCCVLMSGIGMAQSGGWMMTVAERPAPDYAGTLWPAVSAQLDRAGGISVDFAGNLVSIHIHNYSYFPHVIVGDGWSATFSFTNTGLAEASGTLNFKDSQGIPMPISGQFNDATSIAYPASIASSYSFVIPPGQSIYLSAKALDESNGKTIGWAQLDTLGTIAGMVTYEHVADGKTDCYFSAPGSSLIQVAAIPIDMDKNSGNRMAYDIANPGTQAISVEMLLISQESVPLGQPIVVKLGPGEQISEYLSIDREKFKGLLVLHEQKGQPFLAFGLLEKQGFQTAAPLILFQ
jgi:hypothetical protein